MRLHLIGVSALVSAMETEALLRQQPDAPRSEPTLATAYARALGTATADWLEPPRETPH